MELNGNESEAEDMFSDEDGTEKVNESSPVAPGADKSLNTFLDNSLLFSQDQANVETSGEAVIPKTPLSLVPFMTKGDKGWTSDLETPVSNKLSKMMNKVNKMDNENKSEDDDQECTPKNTALTAGQDEFVPASPVVSSRKAKRHAKRRIFNRDSRNKSLRNSTDTPQTLSEDNSHSNSTISESRETSNKENISRRVKSEEGLGNLDENEPNELDALVEKYKNLRELSKKLNRVTERTVPLADSNEKITNDVFVKNIRALETADREHCRKNQRQPPSKTQNHVSLPEVSTKDNVESAFMNKEILSGLSDLEFSPWKTDQSQDTDASELINDGFRGFTREEQHASQFLLSRYSRIFQIEDQTSTVSSTDYDTLSSRSTSVSSRNVSPALSSDFDDDFEGFTPCDRASSLEKTERIRQYYEKLLEEERIMLEIANEPRFLPPIVMTVKTGYKNYRTDEEVLVSMTSVYEASDMMIRENNIDLLLEGNKLADETVEISLNDSTLVGDDDDYDSVVKSQLMSEFKTAGGRELYVGRTALERAKWVLEDDCKNTEDDVRLNFPGIARVFTDLGEDGEAEKKIDQVTIVADEAVELKVHDKAEETLAKTLEDPAKNKCTRKSIVKFMEPEKITPSVDLNKNKTPKTPAATVTPLGGFNSGGFSSSRGKPMNISRDALLRAQAKFNEDLEAGPSAVTETTPKMSTDLLNKNVGGFTLGGGSPVIISDKLLKKARVKFEDEFKDEAPRETTPQQNLNITPRLTASCAGGFATATGKSFNISKDTLLKVKAKFGENFDEFKTEETTPGGKSNFNDVDLDGNFDGNCLEEMKNLKKKIESRSSAGGQGKRVNPSDDVTPFGRKRTRWGGSTELQARKLFDDAEQEAENQPSTSSNNFHRQKAVKQEKSSKNPIDFEATFVGECSSNISDDSEELRSATEDFLQDIQNSPSNSMTKYRSRITKGDNKRPCSLPSTASLNSQDNKKIHIRSLSPNYHESIPDDIDFDTQFFEDDQKIDKNKLSAALENQRNAINLKKTNREKPLLGSYLKQKRDKVTKSIQLQNLCERGSVLPPVRNQSQLAAQKIDPQVISINSTTAASYEFNLSDFYPKNHGNNSTIGLSLDDSVQLIPKENHLAGLEEFEQSFLASPGVDPSLLPRGWFKNHYKWIVWKLAAMDSRYFKNLPRCLTPQSLMSQLKYRYDREIDRSERPVIRKILEMDSVASRRMVLCVSRVLPTARVSDCNTPISELELTDGWYSIRATIDSPLNFYINKNKIKAGTKLMIHGAQLVNLEEGAHPLDAPSDVRLKISTNSTRRVKWFTKMGYQRQSGPMKMNLKHINPNGGLIGKIIVAVARIYPILYREKTDDGKVIFRNSRCEEKAVDEFSRICQAKAEAVYDDKNGKGDLKMMNIKPRNVSPCLKILITDGSTSGLVTIWSSAEECSQVFKETSCIGIYNCQASGMRSNELQLTANRWTTFHEFNKNLSNIHCPGRVFTSIESMSGGFSPIYGEFDTIGVVVSIGSAPPGMKCFETMNLAYRNENNVDCFMSILFWQGISEYGYSEIANIGSVIICKNLQWRKNTPPSCIPLAFCTEKTVISRNARQNPHLQDEFESLVQRIEDVQVFVDSSAKKINEMTKKTSGGVIPVGTPNLEDDTRTSRASNKSRIERLKNYGPATSMSPISIGASPRVSLGYRPPVVIKNTNKTISTTTCHKKL